MGKTCATPRVVETRSAGYRVAMKPVRVAVLFGLAKKAYDIARKPENQRRIKQAAARLQAQRAARR